MSKRRKSAPSPRAKRAGKRASSYAEKLKTLRKFTSEFDAAKFQKIYASRPTSTKGKAAKRAALSKVSRTFQRLRPYIHRPHKVVRPGSVRNRASLREYVGMGNFKNLKAIPVPTDRNGTLKVKFDRQGRVKVIDGASEQKVFLFPHSPRDHFTRNRLTKGMTDDIVEMTEKMVKTMPRGQYVLFTRHHFLMPTVSDRDDLVDTIKRFVYQYQGAPEFLKMLRGFKWLTNSYEKVIALKEHMRTERGRLKVERKRIKAEAAARAIAQMDRQFKSGKLPKLSKRARATGRR